jgi:vacuolar protein sorting-associated protein 13A/C
MFESLLSSVLNKVLGEFIEGFDPNKLNLSIWGGDVKIEKVYINFSILIINIVKSY